MGGLLPQQNIQRWIFFPSFFLGGGGGGGGGGELNFAEAIVGCLEAA